VNQALRCLRRPGVIALLGVSLPVLADSVQLDPVVVTGARGSAGSAQERKRVNDGIVDSVVASDIHKLPDLSVSEAVQRVTGVQIVRDRGEGSAVSVRGLTQVETTLNGREVFTAGSGRTLDFADISADMVTGIDVHKTSSADRIEGGLGGTIDLRTRRPFDFAGDATVLSARSIRGDLVDRNAEQFSALLSGLTAADTPGRVGPNPYGDFLNGQAGSIGSYLVGDLSGARNGVDLRNSFGITQPIPAGGDPLSVWRIKEQTHALYVAGAFQAIPNELDGQAGLRVVHTRESVTGTQAVTEHGPVVARIAYNWRSKFRTGVSSIAGTPTTTQSFPIYTYGYGWLDASFGYRINDQVTVTLEAPTC